MRALRLLLITVGCLCFVQGRRRRFGDDCDWFSSTDLNELLVVSGNIDGDEDDFILPVRRLSQQQDIALPAGAQFKGLSVRESRNQVITSLGNLIIRFRLGDFDDDVDDTIDNAEACTPGDDYDILDIAFDDEFRPWILAARGGAVMVGKVEIDELAAVDLNGMESTFPTCSVEPGTEIMFDMMVDAAFPASMMGAGDSIIGDTDIVKPTAIAFDRNNNLWIAVSVLDDPAADTHKAPTLYLLKSNTDGGDLEIVGPVFIGDQKNAQMIGLGDTFFSGDSFSSLCMGGQGFLAFEVGGMEFDCGDDLWLGTAPQPQVVCMDGMAVGGTPLTNLFSITHYYEGSTFLAEEGGLDSFAVAGRISANGILAQISDNDLDRARRTSASIIETSNEVEADIFSILSDRGVGGNTKGFKGLTGLSQNRGDGGDQCKCPYEFPIAGVILIGVGVAIFVIATILIVRS